MTFEAATATKEGGGAGEVFWGNGRVALQVGGGGRRTGDVATPEGDVDNSQSRTGFGTVGLSLTGAKGYFGGSYGYDDLKYGTPVVEDGQIQLTPRRHAFDAARRHAEPDRDLRLVQGVGRRPALQARRARGRRRRDAVHEQHGRRGRARHAQGVRASQGQRWRRRAEPRVRLTGRRSAGAGDRSVGLRRVPLRRADVATLHVSVRRPRRADQLHAGGRAEA